MPVARLCYSCHQSLPPLKATQMPLRFCPYCGERLHVASHQHLPSTTASLVEGHAPTAEQIKLSIGPYQILESIGKGGMGEVFLAYDTVCGRRIALKKIRADLLEHVQLQHRFLKEAHITSQLTHPAIIPIYTIHREENLIYYTMPFVEGDTLKEIIRRARKEEKKGKHANAVTYSIPALIRVFLSICQAVAYAHAKNVLHRDLKPANIIIGQYGEVLILDWGLAKVIDDEDSEEQVAGDVVENAHPLRGITRFGKVVGTVSYMAPERAFGKEATKQTDIYSLGVILYQLLTLQPPFRRGTLTEFRASYQGEVLEDPAKVAPYRDVPRPLARIAQKCLEVNLDARYHQLEELIHDLENFIEGRSEWFQIAELSTQRKEDWEFRENFFINEHMAITRGGDLAEWVSLMVSKSSFNGNTMLVAKVKCGEKSQGIGFMLCIPEVAERVHVNDGYCLWLGTDLAPQTKLLRSTVEVISRPEITLQRGIWYTITLEKVADGVRVYLDNVLQFFYISHIPLLGTHIGVLTRDADFDLQPLCVYVSSLNLTVNCLAIPDSMLAHKHYDVALNEYRRIAYSFPGRAEGREALFKAGVTLLEQARNCAEVGEAENLYDKALQEFSKQHSTPGAPLEYVGKGLVYQALRDYDEEIKCYELAFRRYREHPLLSVLYEQTIYRMYETSKYDRRAAYQFILLSVRFLPKALLTGHVRKLFNSLKKHWEPLDFICCSTPSAATPAAIDQEFAIQLAFWLAKPHVCTEIITELLNEGAPSASALSNAIFSLLELGSIHSAANMYGEICETLAETATFEEGAAYYNAAAEAISWHTLSIQQATQRYCERLETQTLSREDERLFSHLIHLAQKARASEEILCVTDQLALRELRPEFRLQLESYRIWSLLQLKRWQEAGSLLHSHPIELLSKDSSPLYFLYGCWLLVTEGRDIADIHFAGALEASYPRSWMLFAYVINGKIDLNQAWLQKAFLWEKRQLMQQLSLFYHCAGDTEKAEYYYHLELQEYV